MNPPQLMLIGPHQLPQPPQRMEEPPARVKVAMDYLRDLTMKTMPQVAVNGMEIREIDLTRLTSGETSVQSTACDLLKQYFTGSLQPDHWERQQGEFGGELNRRAGMLLRCPSCLGDMSKPDCLVCKGAKDVIVFPAAGGNQ